MKPTLPLASLPLLLLASSCGSGGGGGGSKTSPPHDLEYAENPASYVLGFAIAANPATVSGTVDAWSVDPPLPAGLALDATTGAITGTPHALQAPTDHVVTASNAFGSTTETLSIAVLAPAAAALFVASAGDGAVGSFHADPSLLHSGYALSSGAGRLALAARPDGGTLYAANAAQDDVAAFPIDPATGRLGAPVLAAAGSQPSAVAVDPTGAFLYVANRGDDTISTYTLDAAGVPTAGGAIATGDEPSALAIDAAGRFLYAACAGSGDVERFAIDPSTGALTPGGAVAAGVGPESLALAAAPGGTFLYVANAGDDTISQYAVDGTTGAPAPLAPAAVALASGADPRDLAAHPSGAFLYGASRGSDAVLAFAIDAGTGTLAPLATASEPVGDGPVALAVEPAGGRLYVVHELDDEVRVLAIDAGGALAAAERVRARDLPCDLAFGVAPAPREPISRFAYVTSEAPSSLVAQFSVDTAASDLTALSPASVPADADPRGVAIHPAGGLVLVSSEDGAALSLFTRDPANGLLVAAGTHPESQTFDAEIEPSGRFAYVTRRLTGLQPYALDLAGPTLAPLTLAPAGVDPRGIDVDPTGRFLLAAETTGGVFAYAIAPETGELAALGSIAAAGNTVAVEVHPSGRFAYASNFGGQSISMYALDEGGLAALAPPSVGTGLDTNPAGLAFSRDGAHLYVAYAGADAVAHFTVDLDTGQLAFVGQQPTFAQQPIALATDVTGRILLALNGASGGVITRFELDPATGEHEPVGFDSAGTSGPAAAVFSTDLP